jgi:hypothetical protein
MGIGQNRVKKNHPSHKNQGEKIMFKLINNRIPQANLKMTEQGIGIADHADAAEVGIKGHFGHHRFIHMTGEIAVKGLAV